MIKIGITGNIGAGKSQVCRIFELLEIPVYYADPRARQLMKSDPELKKKIQKLLGPESYDQHGELNRQYIGQIIFKDKTALTSLNNLVHPAVGLDFNTWAKNQKSPYILKEAALLFESGSYKQLDLTVLVKASEAVRLRRVVARDGIDRSAVLDRMRNQMAEEEKE